LTRTAQRNNRSDETHAAAGAEVLSVERWWYIDWWSSWDGCLITRSQTQSVVLDQIMHQQNLTPRFTDLFVTGTAGWENIFCGCRDRKKKKNTFTVFDWLLGAHTALSCKCLYVAHTITRESWLKVNQKLVWIDKRKIKKDTRAEPRGLVWLEKVFWRIRLCIWRRN